ncbi:MULTISPECIES: hypothetical protein [unclassified Halobacteriovorax]|uniref:hypothetical protein n=1 Tax=unclassified Halobacteriovorax TaxID=2639665 RepID=UPI000EA2442C|nr:hypothetical protein [Halobacteriovorax sp. BALOs_7]AYF45174.1 hypothetical protein BALOs_2176 [Halobacteriovorax sp. BALOs_7]
MKSFVLPLILVMASSNLFAAGNVSSFLKSLEKLDGQEGRVSSNTNERGTGECQIEILKDTQSTSIYFRNTGYYFTPVAHAFSDSAELVDANTLLVSEDSNRPGGDACGSYGGESGYKKTITLNGDSVTIRETFRCFLFKKYDFSFTCKL